MNLLTDTHQHMLTVESSIAPEVIAERGYRSFADPGDIRDLGFNKAQARTAPVLAMPLWDVHGQQTGWQIRPDRPRQGKAGKLYKYETPAKGRVSLDVHPRVQPLLGNPAIPLWLTEGVKKGDALVSHGACAIAFMGGVWGFRGTNEHGGKVILPAWEHVALNNRLVHVAFDSDLHTKRGVRQALTALYTFLRSRGAIPTRVQWPEAYQQQKVGVDDYLAQGHTLDELLALIPQPGPLPQTPPRSATQQVSLTCTKDGRPRPLLSNILKVLEQDPHWRGALGYNELTNEATLLRCPPYQEEENTWRPSPLLEHDYSEASNWLQRQYDLCTATTLVAEGLQTFAHRFPYHPIRDYLAGLTWDKTPRLDTWLTTYCQTEDTTYTRAIASKTLIAAVARVQEPGCKVDTVTILEADQGERKSTVWRILASDAWFSDALPDVHDKDAAQSIRGTWVVELGELAALQRSELEAIKRFLSANQDRYRPSYGRIAMTVPRHNIFVGSTNKDAYLKDETGNRRFWPVATGRCDVDALARDRDQLWAEALARYQQREAWYLTPELEQLAVTEQANRVEADDWESPVLKFAEELERGYVTTREILVDLFKFENPALHTPANTKRIGGLLRRNGWRRQTVRDTAGNVIKAFAQPVAPGVPGEEPVTPVTLAMTEKVGRGYTVSTNNDADVTDVTLVTPTIEIVERRKNNENDAVHANTFLHANIEVTGVGVTAVTGVTGVTGGTPSLPPCAVCSGLVRDAITGLCVVCWEPQPTPEER